MKDNITSPQNPRIKAVVELRQARARREAGLILIDGLRDISRALDAGLRLNEAFICEEMIDGESALEIVDRLRGSAATVTTVSQRVLEKIRYGDLAGGIVVVAQRPRISVDEWCDAALNRDRTPLIAVIDGLEKPGNVGAILRSADGAGVTGVIVTDPASDPFGPNAIRASTGAIFMIPLLEASASDTRELLMDRHITIVAASPHAQSLYTEVDFRRPVAIVLGSEARGLAGGWEQAVGARIPMNGGVDSLNVSVSAALVFYEAARQRGV